MIADLCRSNIVGKFSRSLFPVLSGCLLLAACNSSGDSGSSSALTSAQPEATQEVASLEDRSQDPRAFCPKTSIRDGTEVYRTFAKGVKKEDANAMASLEFQSTITEVARECNYTPSSLGMKVGIKGRVINGPTGASGNLNVPVRVAIANPITKEVVYSQLHQVPVNLPVGQSNASFRFVDSQINIPVPEGRNLVVFVGFDEGPPA